MSIFTSRVRKKLIQGLCLFLGCPVPAQQLRKVLRKGRARQHHVATHLVRFLLEISLHVRKESDHRGFLVLAFEFGNQRQGLHAGAVQIEDNQRRFLFPILLDLVRKVVFGFDKFNLDVQLARGFLNLGLEEQIIDEAEDSLGGILARRQRLRFGLRVGGRKTGALLPAWS